MQKCLFGIILDFEKPVLTFAVYLRWFWKVIFKHSFLISLFGSTVFADF